MFQMQVSSPNSFLIAFIVFEWQKSYIAHKPSAAFSLHSPPVLAE